MGNISLKKKILIVLACMLGLFVLLDFGFLWANLKFALRGTTTSFSSTHVNSAQNMQPNTLVIDSLGVSAPIVYVNEKSEKAYQAALVNGVVHFPGTASPGELGNCYIFGHSSDFFWSKGHYKTVFATLPHISLGAEIKISDQQGSSFTYVVTGSRKVSANDLSVLGQQGYQKKLLTLQTSYPVGTALARWVVVAELKQ